MSDIERRVADNGMVYWVGFVRRGKRRYSIDRGRTWAASLIKAVRQCEIYEQRELRTWDSHYPIFEGQ